jgi:archaeal flagellar protein FlaI
MQKNTDKEKEGKQLLQTYKLNVNNILVEVQIIFYPEDTVPRYMVNITNMSKTTKIILEKIREEFISEVGVGVIELTESGGIETIKGEFKKELTKLLKKYFPNADEQTKDMLINYVIEQNLGLGNIEILLKDDLIEEIVVNSAKEPVWIYHKEHAWLKTNIILPNEARIRHFSTMIGRDVNKEISQLSPLMDAHLLTGDRVNATLEPISSFGNTITIRKFAKDPWTITDFIRLGTIDIETAALIWLCMQNELSLVIAGGTGSGKTSMLNVIASFLPPNQRTISIEDTRELQLPNTLHWVPLETRLANPEGKGGITMLDLIINALRMRPDRIIMGEIRRQKEAETLFEAVHTGHSCYATFHANDVRETITRLTNPPINIPKLVLPAMNLIVIQNRNRRTNKRKTMQFAEILPSGEPNIIRQYDPLDDKTKAVGRMHVIPHLLRTFTGMTHQAMEKDLHQKVRILKWMVDHNIRNLNDIGVIMSKYYRGKLTLK